MAFEISRAAYADMYGPTTGDRVRLADTELVIEVERDLTTYGDEVKFGGGKVLTIPAFIKPISAYVTDVFAVLARLEIRIRSQVSTSSSGQGQRLLRVKARLLRRAVLILIFISSARSRLTMPSIPV